MHRCSHLRHLAKLGGNPGNLFVGKLFAEVGIGFVDPVIVIVVKLLVTTTPLEKALVKVFVGKAFVGAVIVMVVNVFVKMMVADVVAVETVFIDVVFGWKGCGVKVFVTNTPGEGNVVTVEFCGKEPPVKLCVAKTPGAALLMAL